MIESRLCLIGLCLFVLSISGCQAPFVMPACQSWEQMVETDRVSSIRIGGFRGGTALQMEFIYANNAEPGACALGSERFKRLARYLDELDKPAIAFWVGAHGPMDIFYKPESLFLVQADNRYELMEIQDLEPALRIDGTPELFSEDLLIFEGHPDPIDPVTIFYRQREILLSGEYWLE